MGIGDWAQSPIPIYSVLSPITNPHYDKTFLFNKYKNK